MPITFAHMSDVHLGAWSDHPDMINFPIEAFNRAADVCIKRKVDFLLISGDLFDTSLPNIDVLVKAVEVLRKLHGIPVYAIAGSHDYSPTGKTMLNVLERAGLLTLVDKHEEIGGKLNLRFTTDKTGAKIAGISGKKGALETALYENLHDDNLHDENLHDDNENKGLTIFMLHSGISEYKPQHMDMRTVSLTKLPKADYYAAGHIHMHFQDNERRIYFPSSLFPTDFEELERYECGFYIVEQGQENIPEWIKLKLFDVASIKISTEGKTSKDIERDVMDIIEKEYLDGKVLLLRIDGVLEGTTADINLKDCIQRAYDKGAKIVKKRIRVTTKEYEEITVEPNKPIEDIEKSIIEGYITENNTKYGHTEIKELIDILKDEKQEGETRADFENRIKLNIKKVLSI